MNVVKQNQQEHFGFPYFLSNDEYLYNQNGEFN